MTPIEEVKTICESIIDQWRDNTLPDKATNIATFADTILTILNKEEKMKDRFDLENEIMELYSFASNLNGIAYGVLECDLSRDDIANALSGLKVLLELHITKLTGTMSQAFFLDEYNEDNTV